MKYIVLFLIALLYIKEIPQPPPQPQPLVEQTVTFCPIVENIDLGRDYWYIRTIKVYYTDSTPTPILLSNGDSLTTYCTDSTSVSFISSNDTIIIYSVKRMSCAILAVINLNDTHVSFLRNNAVKRAVIHNLITDNVFNVEIKDSTYFKRVLKAFEGK